MSREITPQDVVEHGLTEGEYQLAVDTLGRTPTWTELGVLSVMWSEHCSYKSSRVHLSKFPTTGPRVVVGPGENAGIVSIGDDLCIAFKMESHNHPSYIEPFQGAATGVGGILRDVFTMGARPIAAMNSLRFGEWSHEKTRHLLHGVVAGIGSYGNCFGVPMVGGEMSFHPAYNGNCLVNAFVAGVVRKDRIFLGTAAGPGNPVLYVGARTGRDGIHGATMASESFEEDSEAKRPTVQVGDPFHEKLLLEACLELMEEDCLVGIQDMGAAGLTSSTVEMAGRGGTGMLLELDKIPTREPGMVPYELLLSESQERMIMVVREGLEEKVVQIFEKWDLQACTVGRVTDDGMWRCHFKGEEVCAIPVPLLTDAAPKYDRPMAPPKDLEERHQIIGNPTSEDPGADLLALMGSPDLCSREWVYRQYDHQVGTNTIELPGADAAVVRIKGTSKAIAVSTDCNGRHVWLDPREGAKGVLAEGARNLSCVGAVPIGATDCLNFGNPEKPEIMWQFSEAVEGLSEGCRALDIPIVSGNVSFYNETDQTGILPTPSVALVGLIEGEIPNIRGRFGREGLAVAILGRPASHGIGGSYWLHHIHGQDRGKPPPVDLEFEATLHGVLRQLIRDEVIEVAHDISDGGLLVAMAECCFPGREIDAIGVRGRSPGDAHMGSWFGEDHGRVVIAYSPEKQGDVESTLNGVPLTIVGTTGGNRLQWDEKVDVSVDELLAAWSTAIPNFADGA